MKAVLGMRKLDIEDLEKENGPYHSLADWVRPKHMSGKGGMVEANGRYHLPSCACATHR